ncbi:hypothetical protein UF75_0451 [Desulfosporosinus sp. I2]|uniref:Uncharacterized protein n=1 Tax=Desulfosporosinus metallidurans TaxID=1888891 RepID=A0A1Q8QZ92_9FIRM|nr:hypothetical protein UF75_0451 [Desulfosporosinus sp. I2]OLN32500.1 hypothetical protein DSOL_1536 [Desulfosporosinus metallidurans]
MNFAFINFLMQILCQEKIAEYVAQVEDLASILCTFDETR